MGSVCSQNKKPKDSIVSYQKYLKKTDLVKRKASMVRSLENIPKVKKQNQKTHSIRFAQSLIDLDKGDFKKALYNLERAFKLNPRSVDYSYFIAKIYFEQGHYKDCLRYLDISLKLDSTNRNNLILLSECYIKMNRFDEAEKTIEKGLHYHKENVKLIVLMGFVQELLGEYADAIGYYLKLFTFPCFKDEVYLQCKLAYNYLKIDNREKAYTYIRMAKNISPNSDLVCFILIYLCT